MSEQTTMCLHMWFSIGCAVLRAIGFPILSDADIPVLG